MSRPSIFEATRRRVTACVLLCLLGGIATIGAHAQQGTVARFTTDAGVFDVRLADDNTPLTVANFLEYVNSGDYDGSFIHRSAKLTSGEPFVVQGGGFREQNNSFEEIPKNAAVQNEPVFSNTRGTVAMAKLGGQPNSATNQWFVSLRDNASILDGQNGGFTVFGLVIDNGMAVVDAIAALPTQRYPFSNGGTAFDDTPLDDGFTTGQADAPVPGNLVVVQSVRVVSDLPTITGLDEAAVRGALTAAGFTVGTVSEVAATGSAACGSLSYRGALNDRAVPGSVVSLDVVTRRAVPDLTDLSEADARAALTNAGLTVGTVTGARAAARVQTQSAAAGEVVSCGSAVDLALAVPAKDDFLLDFLPAIISGVRSERSPGEVPSTSVD